MDFSLSSDQEALREGVRNFCEARLSMADLRALEQAGVDQALWAEFAEMGILGLRIPEAAGGVGLGMAEAVLVFEELGRCVAPGPLLWSHLAAGLVDGVDRGEVIVTGLDLRNDRGGPYTLEWLDLADLLLVLSDEGVELISSRDIVGKRVGSPLDPLTPVTRVEHLPPGEQAGDADLARKLAIEGTALVSAMMLGIAEASQELATAFAVERQQFGRAIGSFQAVKHILADCFVRQELARASAYAAGVLLDESIDSRAERTVSAASLIAEEAAMKNARACIQVHGGMGFTWENPSHLYLKRAWVLENTLARGVDRAERLAQQVAESV
ncbi:MAG: acyl-CoA/acyl-ACP dehydrogenase [bacterium]|nr:acyl-CoA/acyl-ACP dehydrogenase [bacterium]